MSGRTRMGDISVSQSSAYRHEIIKPRVYRSRRRPDGVCSILGIPADSLPREQLKAIDEAEKALRSRQKVAKGQKKTAATKKLKELKLCRAELLTTNSTTLRVRRHRAMMTKKQRIIEGAKHRVHGKYKGKVKPDFYGRTSKRVRVGEEVDLDNVKGEILEIQGTNVKNTVTAAHVIVKRTRNSRAADRRLAAFAVVPKEIFDPSSAATPKVKR